MTPHTHTQEPSDSRRGELSSKGWAEIFYYKAEIFYY
jgi:hypothetical protein